MHKIKNIIRTLVIAITLMSFSPLRSQYYVEMGKDPSGINTALHLAELNAKAEQLCNLFDTLGYVGQFKVFAGGFYAMQEFYDPFTYSPAFDTLKVRAAAQSPYYLLFGRETNASSGVFVKYWVDIKLPDNGEFGCLDSLSMIYRKAISAKQEIETNKISGLKGFWQSEFEKVEIESMNLFLTLINSIVECCFTSNKSLHLCSPCLVIPEDVLFEKDVSQVYGFDDSFGTKVYAKTIEVGKSDPVGVLVYPASTTAQAYFLPETTGTEPITFSVNPHRVETSNSSLTLTGITTGENSVLRVRCVDEYGELVKKDPINLVQLEVDSYTEKLIKLSIRVVHDTDIKCLDCKINQAELQQSLNEIYKSAVLKIEVKVLPDMTISYDKKDSLGNKNHRFDAYGPNGGFGPEWNAVTDSCGDPEADKMLFILWKYVGRGTTAGLSHRSYKNGFVFAGSSPYLDNVIAHELGHLLGSKGDYKAPNAKDYLMYYLATFNRNKKLCQLDWRSFRRLPN